MLINRRILPDRPWTVQDFQNPAQPDDTELSAHQLYRTELTAAQRICYRFFRIETETPSNANFPKIEK